MGLETLTCVEIDIFLAMNYFFFKAIFWTGSVVNLLFLFGLNILLTFYQNTDMSWA